MADYTKTITNSVNFFGGGPSTKWGEADSPYTMTWGVDKWGDGTNTTILNFIKSQSESITFTDVFTKSADKVVLTSFSAESETVSEGLKNGIWSIVFVSDTTEAENRDFASWTASSSGSASFTCIAAGSTTWS